MFQFTGLIVFAIGVFISRIVMTKALSHLSDEEKLRLINDSPNLNLYTSAILILYLLVYIATFYAFTSYVFIETTALYLVLLASVGALSVIKYKRLVRLDLPSEYLGSNLFATAIVIAGVLAMSVINTYSLFPAHISK